MITICFDFFNPSQTNFAFPGQFSEILPRSSKTRVLYTTRGKSPDNVNFCQPVIIRNQIYSKYNFTFDLPHQKTSIRTKVMDDQNDSPKLTTNTSFNSPLVFYSPIPTTYFLPHQKILIRPKVTALQTFKATRP